MSTSKPSNTTRVATATGTIGGQFLAALVIMFALHLLHHDVHGVPALGYWSVFWSIVGVSLVATSIGAAALRQSRS